MTERRTESSTKRDTKTDTERNTAKHRQTDRQTKYKLLFNVLIPTVMALGYKLCKFTFILLSSRFFYLNSRYNKFAIWGHTFKQDGALHMTDVLWDWFRKAFSRTHVQFKENTYSFITPFHHCFTTHLASENEAKYEFIRVQGLFCFVLSALYKICYQSWFIFGIREQ